MLKYIMKRLASALTVLIAVSFLTFIVLNLTPGESAMTVLTHTFVGFDEVVYEQDLKAVTDMHGLHEPMIVQYIHWLKEAIKGNLGTSYVYSSPVTQILKGKVPYTLLLGGLSFVLSLILGIPLGIKSALGRNKFGDQITRILSVLFVSIPSFWLGLVIIIFFSVNLNWLPVAGMEGMQSIVLPCITLMAGMLPVILRITRSSMIEVLGQDYMTVAKIKGLSQRDAVLRHGIRNAMPPVITMAGLQLGHILGGSVLIETVFVWPGIGKLLIDSITAKDVPMLQGCILVIALGYIVANLLVDIIFAIIDPRIKIGGDI